MATPTLLQSPMLFSNITLQKASSIVSAPTNTLMVANSKLIKNALMPQPGKIRHFQGCIPAVPCQKKISTGKKHSDFAEFPSFVP